MTVILYSNASTANTVNKSLTQVDSITGTLREPTSLINPTITITRSNPLGFNYFYVEEFGRYYYLTGISSVYNGLISISGHVDVLKTYQSAIANMNAIVRRQENSYNLYLDDGIFKAYQNTKHKIIAWPNSFDEFSYVLALAGNGGN